MIREFRHGPLGDDIDEFVTLLIEQGYSRNDLTRRFGPISDFNRWLINQGLKLQQLRESTIDEFVGYRTKRIPASVRRGDLRMLTQLIDLLRRNGRVPLPKPPSVGPIECVLQSYSAYLRDEKGLATSSVKNCCRRAGDLLLKRFGEGPLELTNLTHDDVVSFLTWCGERYSSKHTQVIASALRSFLRFLWVNGNIGEGLAGCIPAVPAWRACHLPEFLTRTEVRLLLKTCKRRSAKGRRDYAILLLLVRLGLRASEVLHLTLDDIDWKGGEIRIRGKGAQRIRLPLPCDVGEAIVAYIRWSRPVCSCRNLFIRTRAPLRGFSNPSSISTIVRRAILAAGLNPQHKGAHLLRYTMATDCLRQGATLFEVGDLLGHCSSDTTALYAKVDVARLRELALPWPINN
jgi:site-specific recombinase XerD